MYFHSPLSFFLEGHRFTMYLFGMVKLGAHSSPMCECDMYCTRAKKRA